MYPRRRFPPKAESIAPLRKIVIDNERESGASGSLHVLKKGFRLRLDSSTSKNRRNFSVAHEIGHTYFFNIDHEPPVPLLPLSEMSSPRIERLCNVFAACLLLPREVLSETTETLQSSGPSVGIIEESSRKLTVSPETMIRRMQELDALRNSETLVILAKAVGGSAMPRLDVIGDRARFARLRLDEHLLAEHVLAVDGAWEQELGSRGSRAGSHIEVDSKTYGRGKGMYSIAVLRFNAKSNTSPFSS